MTLTRERLDELAKKYPPPQEWYDEDFSDFFSNEEDYEDYQETKPRGYRRRIRRNVCSQWRVRRCRCPYCIDNRLIRYRRQAPLVEKCIQVGP